MAHPGVSSGHFRCLGDPDCAAGGLLGVSADGHRRFAFHRLAPESQRRQMAGKGHEERFSMPSRGAVADFQADVGEYSVGGRVLVACDLNLHHLAVDLIDYGFEAGSSDP